MRTITNAIEILENPEVSELELSEAVAELMDGIETEADYILD